MSEGGVRLTFEVEGMAQFDRSFSRFTEGVKDYSEAFKGIVKSFHAMERRQFESEGSYGSGGWTGLAPGTLNRKPAGLPILVLTGVLRESLTGGARSIAEIEPMQLRVGSSVKYGTFHQLGTGKMPARPPIEMPEAVKTDWGKIIHRYLVKRMSQVKGA